VHNTMVFHKKYNYNIVVVLSDIFRSKHYSIESAEYHVG